MVLDWPLQLVLLLADQSSLSLFLHTSTTPLLPSRCYNPRPCEQPEIWFWCMLHWRKWNWGELRDLIYGVCTYFQGAFPCNAIEDSSVQHIMISLFIPLLNPILLPNLSEDAMIYKVYSPVSVRMREIQRSLITQDSCGITVKNWTPLTPGPDLNFQS